MIHLKRILAGCKGLIEPLSTATLSITTMVFLFGPFFLVLKSENPKYLFLYIIHFFILVYLIGMSSE